MEVVALIVAVVAAWYAYRAARSADESVRLAREEHNLFLAELRARAHFVLTANPQDAAEDGNVYTDATNAVYVYVVIGIANIGEKAAGPTTLNVLVPQQGGHDLRWCVPGGAPTGHHPMPIPETLTQANGNEAPATYVSDVLPRVGRRDHPVKMVRLDVHVPPEPGSTVEIPIRVTADADELADDKPEATLDTIVRVVRGTP